MSVNEQAYWEVVNSVETDFHELSRSEIEEVYGAPSGMCYDDLFDFCVNVEIENFYK